MSEPFVGEIRMFAGNFAPIGWAFCDGQLLAVSSNDALFSLLGTIYGGDGRTTFGLPDLRGRVPIHYGQGPGLDDRRLGAKSGAENVNVTIPELPIHTHEITATDDLANSPAPSAKALAKSTAADHYINDSQSVSLGATAVTRAGGGQQHTNLMPTLCLHFIIALFGIYPSRH